MEGGAEHQLRVVAQCGRHQGSASKSLLRQQGERQRVWLRPFLRVTYTVPGGTGTTTATAMSVPDDDATASGATYRVGDGFGPRRRRRIAALHPDDVRRGGDGEPDVHGREQFRPRNLRRLRRRWTPDLGTYRPSTGEWRIWTSRTKFASPAPITWGAENDVPVPADYDADGRHRCGRISTIHWRLARVARPRICPDARRGVGR